MELSEDSWRYGHGSTDFYIAIYGLKERLETLCEYVAQIVDLERNLCPQFLWPEFKGNCEAYLTIQDDPQPWLIRDGLPLSGWLPQFVKDGATLYLADQKGPATYCEGWKYGEEMPYHFAKRLSREFPDLTFVIGGMHHCAYYANSENWEIRNGKVNRMLSTVCVGDGHGLEAGHVNCEVRDGKVIKQPEHTISDCGPDWEYSVVAGTEPCPTCGKLRTVYKGAESGERWVRDCDHSSSSSSSETSEATLSDEDFLRELRDL